MEKSKLLKAFMQSILTTIEICCSHTVVITTILKPEALSVKLSNSEVKIQNGS